MRTLISILILTASIAAFAGGIESTHIDKYKNRYELATALQKRVDNKGNGFAPLYGVRNFRMVLAGVHYRGGANNLYHQSNPRPNQNPLPDDGLANLCKQGFQTAIYLYSTNFSTAAQSKSCQTVRGEANKLTYLQIDPMNSAGLEKILGLIHESLVNEYSGPIYTHCWNGWHASGLVAATSLRQFCDVPADAAVEYWNSATDGVNGSEYEHVRKRIRDFKPLPGLQLTKDVQAKVCPTLQELQAL
jgi:hypothetical protein